jgi:Spy/CpxP family protein refolding chaperone
VENDFAADMAKMAADHTTQEWWAFLNRKENAMLLLRLGAMLTVVGASLVGGLAYSQNGASAHRDELTTPLIMSRSMFEAGGGVFGLLRLEQVQKELKLTDEQKDKLRALHREVLRDMPRKPADWQSLSPEESKALVKKRDEALANARKELPKILKSDQFERLKQIRLQVEGVAALFNPDVANMLGITDEQRVKLDAVRKDMSREGKELWDSRKLGTSHSEFTARLDKMRRERDKKILAVLTPQQVEMFKKMQGRKIDLDLSPLRKGVSGGVDSRSN